MSKSTGKLAFAYLQREQSQLPCGCKNSRRNDRPTEKAPNQTIAELEARVKELEAENAELRQHAALRGVITKTKKARK